MGGGLVVDASQSVVKADDDLEFALKPAAFIVLCNVRSCAYSTGWCLGLAAEVVVSKAEAVGALGDSIEPQVLDDLEATPKEEEAT